MVVFFKSIYKKKKMRDWMNVLMKTKLLTPKGIFSLANSLRSTGCNLFAILHIANKLYPSKAAVTTAEESYTYHDLYLSARRLACWLKQNDLIAQKQRVAIAGENSPELIFAVFASALLGADIYLLNTQMSTAQLKAIADKYMFDALLCDSRIYPALQPLANNNRRVLPLAGCCDSAKQANIELSGLRGINFSKLVVLTSGSTGMPAVAERKTSVNNYLSVFLSLSKRLKLHEYDSLYLATPLFHGFGVATLCISLLLGKQTFISPGFDAHRACRLIREHGIQAITFVPLMIQRIIESDPESLRSLQCLISGGAPLSAFLLKKIRQTLSGKLYNLYGTSQSGVCTLATPDDMMQFPHTIGRCLSGVKMKIRLSNTKEAAAETEGEIWVRCNWSTNKHQWIPTGDKGYKNRQGYFFLTGRIDNMIVSGGENVYPSELENILSQHPGISDTIVIGINDPEFGQRLKAIVIPVAGNEPEENHIRHWLKDRVSRYQMPKTIRFTHQFPMNSIGKPDAEALRKL